MSDGMKINTGKAKQIAALLNKLPERLDRVANNTIEQEFTRAVSESKSLASSFSDSGLLVSEIRLLPLRKNWAYVSGAPYAAALEFGTKNYVRIPAGFEQMAQSYQGLVRAADGRTPKQRIYAWATRHGIPNRKKGKLFMRIMKQGMPKRGATKVVPHFIPPYVSAKARISRRLKSLLTRAINGNS
jgi:hypothetical protein